eukprot:TRINITY_DN33773_c0_g1_i1.p1 TRINITY_DN33773_c0_g1~~TRINITY_DN33773_c0_g1_i1.p1  ORF type:complete len:465 (+),score=47.13 TRINITY_DN33773_c0_g1_i1:41-1396(+)
MMKAISRRALSMPACSFEPMDYSGPGTNEIVERRKKYIHPVLTWWYPENPLTLVEGKMQYVWDEHKNRYLDLYGGVVTTSVGHCHPRVVNAGVEQMKKIWHTTTLYMNDNYGAMAEYMVGKMPKEHDWVVLFTNSGGEATEFAMLTAKVHTKNHNYITLRNGYHGIGSQGARGATASPGWAWKVPADPSIKHALCPDINNAMFPENTVNNYLSDLDCMIRETCSSVAGFGCENIQGVGGCLELPKGYVKGAYDIVRHHGGICVSDEVQTGFGRLGDCYWGFDKDHDNVVPDVVVCAKSIGNGWPIGAVIVKKHIADSMTGTGFFNTFGGNPVSMAVGLETLKVIDEEGLQKNSSILGERFTDGFKCLLKTHPSIVKSIRGRGLMLGMELHDPSYTAQSVDQLREHGILIGKGGPQGSVLRIKPPMCINADDVDFTLAKLDLVFRGIKVKAV